MILEQCKNRVEELISNPEFRRFLDKEVERLFKSGALDTESADDDFRLPRLILCVALENLSRKYSPLSPDGKRIVQNLRHF